LDDEAMAANAAVAARVGDFYERRPYPPPVDDVEAYRRSWDEERRRAESHLLWPREAFRDDRSVLVAGCGTVQAVHHALRWPRARVVGIDVSAQSIAFATELVRKHRIENLELRRLAVERAADLAERFDCVVCTGVLHHLAEPDAGVRALCDVVAPNGALNLMVYAPYGRTGVYMLQDYCRRLGVGCSDGEIRDLAASLKALPPHHPLAPLLRSSPDFASVAGMADALLHPRDRSYSVAQFIELLRRNGLAFGRWMRQAPYLPACGAMAATPHAPLLARLAPEEQFAAMELFRGTMARHSAVAYPANGETARNAIRFEDEEWLGFVPIRRPDTIVVKERLPPGSSAVLINRNHRDGDLYLPIDAAEERMLRAVDRKQTVAEICNDAAVRERGRSFFQKLWQWDQIVFDASRAA
jgi:SAM-dependent methyltransferase